MFEGYKLYHSNISNKWEIAGLLFLSTVTKEKVEIGVKKSEETPFYDTCRQCEQLYSDETSRMRVCAVFVIKRQLRSKK